MRTNTIKNLIATTVIASACFMIMPTTVNAETMTGEAGTSSTWTYDSAANTITVSGTGKVKDYLAYSLPSAAKRNKPNIVINSGITEIGEQSFSGFQAGNLTVASTVQKVGDLGFGANFFTDSIKVVGTDLGATAYNLAGIKDIEVVDATHLTTTNGNPALGDITGTIKFDRVQKIDDYALSNLTGATIYLPESCTSFGTLSVPNGVMVYGYRDYANMSTMINTGKVDYLNLNNAKIENCNITYEDEWYYTGNVVEPEVTVSYQLTNRTLNLYEDKDYTVSYDNNTEMGTATMTITGKGNWKSSVEQQFTIYGNLEIADIELSDNSYIYDGTAKMPYTTVILYGEELVEGADYITTYSDNTEVGTATVTIISCNNLLKGTKSVIFEIVEPEPEVVDEEDIINTDPVNPEENSEVQEIIQNEEQNNDTPVDSRISIADATINLRDSVFSYDGSEKKPTVTSVVLNGTTLTADVDYAIVYQNNIDIGTAYVSAVGIGNYKDIASVTFNIIGGNDGVYDAGETFVSKNFNYTVTDADDHEVEFISTNKKEAAVVIPGKVTVDGVEYTVTSIAPKAFYKNTTVTSVTIPNTVTSIENYAFYGCTKLKTVKIGNGLDIVGSNAFRKCTKLESITLPKSIDEIGKNAFYGCKKLTKITIKSNEVIDIGDNALKGISSKCTIDVPKKLIAKYRKACTKKTGYKSTMKIK